MENQKYIPALRFHWLTSIYDRLIATFMPEKKFKTALLNNASIVNGNKILDFGTGTATLSIIAAKAVPGAEYTGIDVDEKILKIARSKSEKAETRIRFIKYDGNKLPFADNHFDKVISSLVIHHLTPAQKELAFKEMHRVLTPGGELHIADWGKSSNFFMRLMFHIVQLLDGYKTTNDNVKGKLPAIIKSSGFADVAITRRFNSLLGTIELFKSKK